jgi:hypothetical protein
MPCVRIRPRLLCLRIGSGLLRQRAHRPTGCMAPRRRYIHTGDMRYSPALKSDPAVALFVGAEAMYLDTTYCHQRHASVPPQVGGGAPGRWAAGVRRACRCEAGHGGYGKESRGSTATQATGRTLGGATCHTAAHRPPAGAQPNPTARVRMRWRAGDVH